MSSTPEILSSTPESGQLSADADDYVESRQQPLWHVIVLNVLTLSAYSIIWFWKTWRDLAEHANKIVADADVSGDSNLSDAFPNANFAAAAGKAKLSDVSASANAPAKANLSDVSANAELSDASANSKLSKASANAKPSDAAANKKLSEKSANAKLSKASINTKLSNASANANIFDAFAYATLLKFRKTSPALHTMGLLIPIFQLFQTSLLFSRIASLYPNQESFVRKKPIATGILMSVVMFLLFSLYKLPGAFLLLFLLYVTPFVLAQFWLNKYWKTQEEPDALVRQAFSAGELVSLILGAVLLGLIVTGFAINH